MNTVFDIIVAHDAQLGIGKDNALSWSLPEDMAYFKSITQATPSVNKANIVLMGRHTYFSIPKQFRPLKNRINIVLSRQKTIEEEGVYTASIIKDAFFQSEMLISKNKAHSIFCIGGSQLYHDIIQYPGCRYLYVTYIHSTYDCDAFFPDYLSEFDEVSSTDLLQSKNNIQYQFKKFRKKD